jgi:crossover junction endodeoxyribonuclease RuvC
MTRTLGIDPGYGRMGVAVIERTGSIERLIHSECFETSAKLPHPERLGAISAKVSAVIQEYKPDRCSIETLFFSTNRKTALAVAEARGAVIAAAALLMVPIVECSPAAVKIAVTGYGKAEKAQVIAMVSRILKLDAGKRLDDEYDAIAVAIAGASLPLQTKS